MLANKLKLIAGCTYIILLFDTILWHLVNTIHTVVYLFVHNQNCSNSLKSIFLHTNNLTTILITTTLSLGWNVGDKVETYCCLHLHYSAVWSYFVAFGKYYWYSWIWGYLVNHFWFISDWDWLWLLSSNFAEQCLSLYIG